MGFRLNLWVCLLISVTDARSLQKSKSGLLQVFESWLKNDSHSTNIDAKDIMEFAGNMRFHPYEMAHLYQGDIKGFAGHFEMSNDGRELFLVDLWPKGVVPYIISKSFAPRHVRIIEKAIQQFHLKTCIRFVNRTKEYSHIKFVSDEEGCWSYIGRVRGPQPINLNVKGCMSISTVIHEMMHAIGFIHEQSRPDRDKYVRFFPENVGDKEQLSNFDKFPEMYKDLDVPYDIGSVMQYDEYSFSKDSFSPTMLAIEKGKELGNRHGFSETDVKEINKLYKCNRSQKAIKRKTKNSI